VILQVKNLQNELPGLISPPREYNSELAPQHYTEQWHKLKFV